MPTPHFCQTCIYYEKNIFTRTGESFGMCKNVEVSMKVAVDGKSVMEEDGAIYTEEYFGCIYWRGNGGTILNISNIVKL